MFESTGPWTPEQTREYLEERTVPVRVATRTPGGRLWMLSLWYLFRDGALWCATSADADVVAFLDADREEVGIRLDPGRVHTWDYSERMRDALATAEGVDGGEGKTGE